MSTPPVRASIRKMIDARLRKVNTAIPARVESYDPSNQTITAQPLVKVGYVDESGVRRSEKLPAIASVPIARVGGGSYSITSPLEKGDTVLLMVAQSSIDRWFANGGIVDPSDDRTHALSDAFALGLSPRAEPDALTSEAYASDAMVLAGPQVMIGGSTATQPTFMATSFMSAFTTLITALGAAASLASTGAGTPSDVSAATAAVTGAFATALSTFQSAINATGKTAATKVK